MGATVSSRWFRRNAFALVAVAVLVPATAVVIGGNEWWSMFGRDRVFAVTVDQDAPVDFGGASYGPATASVVPAGDTRDLPDGTKVVTVEVPVRTGEGPATCGSPMLRELSGAGRQWDAAGGLSGIPYDERPASCAPDRTGAYTVVVPFLVPDDVSGPLGLDLTIVHELPRFLRLVVDVP